MMRMTELLLLQNKLAFRTNFGTGIGMVGIKMTKIKIKIQMIPLMMLTLTLMRITHSFLKRSLITPKKKSRTSGSTKRMVLNAQTYSMKSAINMILSKQLSQISKLK